MSDRKHHVRQNDRTLYTSSEFADALRWAHENVTGDYTILTTEDGTPRIERTSKDLDNFQKW